jgi:rubrerythrin
MSAKIERLEEMAEILSIALTRERASVKYYQYAYDRATTEEFRKIFSLFIEQEKSHEAILRAQIHEIRQKIEEERKRPS